MGCTGSQDAIPKTDKPTDDAQRKVPTEPKQEAEPVKPPVALTVKTQEAEDASAPRPSSTTTAPETPITEAEAEEAPLAAEAAEPIAEQQQATPEPIEPIAVETTPTDEFPALPTNEIVETPAVPSAEPEPEPEALLAVDVSPLSLDDIVPTLPLLASNSDSFHSHDGTHYPKPALKHSTEPHSPSSKVLRFQFAEHELVATPSMQHVQVLPFTKNDSTNIVYTEEFVDVEGSFGGYEFCYFDHEDCYRVQQVEAAIKPTAKFSVLTHISLEATGEHDIDTTIVLDNAPLALVRQASMQRIPSFVHPPKAGGVRFDLETTSPTAKNTSSPVPFGRNSSLASPPPNRSLLMARARSERPTLVRQELVRMESGIMMDNCAICQKDVSKGLTCMADDHFICVDCFSPHVRNLCHDMRQLKSGQFSVYCPIPGCLAAPWNSYHVSKCLTGRVLEFYIDTLVQVCKDITEPASPFSPLNRQASAMATPDKRAALQSEILSLKETTSILKSQLLHHGIRPIEYIPLAELNAELSEIFALANRGVEFDEARLDYLLMCMDNNPEYVTQQETKAKAWRDEISTFAAACLRIMRGFVPPNIFHSSFTMLTENDGLHPELAKRFLSKKCLWLVRLNQNSIDKIHEVELMGRFNFEAQGLDVVELAAIYASLPEKFSCDPNGKKTQWKALLEQNLKKADSDARSRALAMSGKNRFIAYTKQEPKFGEMHELHEFTQH